MLMPFGGMLDGMVDYQNVNVGAQSYTVLVMDAISANIVVRYLVIPPTPYYIIAKSVKVNGWLLCIGW